MGGPRCPTIQLKQASSHMAMCGHRILQRYLLKLALGTRLQLWKKRKREDIQAHHMQYFTSTIFSFPIGAFRPLKPRRWAGYFCRNQAKNHPS